MKACAALVLHKFYVVLVKETGARIFVRKGVCYTLHNHTIKDNENVTDNLLFYGMYTKSYEGTMKMSCRELH